MKPIIIALIVIFSFPLQVCADQSFYETPLSDEVLYNQGVINDNVNAVGDEIGAKLGDIANDISDIKRDMQEVQRGQSENEDDLVNSDNDSSYEIDAPPDNSISEDSPPDNSDIDDIKQEISSIKEAIDTKAEALIWSIWAVAGLLVGFLIISKVFPEG